MPLVVETERVRGVPLRRFGQALPWATWRGCMDIGSRGWYHGGATEPIRLAADAGWWVLTADQRRR
jgi:hypothetical protein